MNIYTAVVSTFFYLDKEFWWLAFSLCIFFSLSFYVVILDFFLPTCQEKKLKGNLSTCCDKCYIMYSLWLFGNRGTKNRSWCLAVIRIIYVIIWTERRGNLMFLGKKIITHICNVLLPVTKGRYSYSASKDVRQCHMLWVSRWAFTLIIYNTTLVVLYWELVLENMFDRFDWISGNFAHLLCDINTSWVKCYQLSFCRLFNEYEEYDFARTGTTATEMVCKIFFGWQ